MFKKSNNNISLIAGFLFYTNMNLELSLYHGFSSKRLFLIIKKKSLNEIIEVKV